MNGRTQQQTEAELELHQRMQQRLVRSFSHTAERITFEVRIPAEVTLEKTG